MEEITKFIEQFYDMQEQLLFEKSYWFAVMMKVRFKRGEICYHESDNHWAIFIDDKLYDSLGLIDESEGFYQWPSSFVKDSVRFSETIRNYIKFNQGVSFVEEVLSFISKFSDMKNHYLYGKCYWFAVILTVRFHQAQMVYHPIDNHWAVNIDGILYDASGVIKNDIEGFKPWPGKFKEEDPIHYNRLVKQCIKFTE